MELASKEMVRMDRRVGYQRSRDMTKILSMTCRMEVRRQVSPEMPYISSMNWRQSTKSCGEHRSRVERNVEEGLTEETGIVPVDGMYGGTSYHREDLCCIDHLKERR